MSSIIFDRMLNHVNPGDQCENEEEVDEENYNFNNADVHSKSYLVNLYKNLKNCNYFLNSLIVNERLDYVVISLFKNHHFSFGIKMFDSESVFERFHFTCEDNHIVDYIDNEELPPKLIDMIEMSDLKNIYYNGCIISEIRDYRQSSTDFFNSYFILLKPTSLSLYNDVKKIIGLTNKTFLWTNSARLQLESKLIYLTSPKLCLDPNPCIGILSKKLSRKKLIFGNKLFLRLPRKRLKAGCATEKLKEFKLLNFLKTKKPCSLPKIKVNPNSETSFKINNTGFKDVQELAKEIHEPKENEHSPELVQVEEYLMEFLDIPGASTKLTIFRRTFDDIYFGNIVHTKNGDSKGPPNFYLGTKEMKRRYIEQFVEIFSESGKKLIRITHKVGNEEPKVKHTQAVEIYLLRQQQNMALANKLKIAEQKQTQQQSTMKEENQGSIETKPTLQANIVINNINSNSENSNNNLNISTTANNHPNEMPLTTTANTNTVMTAAVVPKATLLTNNQIVIKNSSIKIINTKEMNNDQYLTLSSTASHHQQPCAPNPVPVPTSTPAPPTPAPQTTFQQPVVIATQNGTQIPIRIPLSFSLQQLKSGQIALVPNTSTASAAVTLANSAATVINNNNNNNVENHTHIQTQQQPMESNHVFTTNSTNKDLNKRTVSTSTSNNDMNCGQVLPTNSVSLILQGNNVFTAQPTQQI